MAQSTTTSQEHFPDYYHQVQGPAVYALACYCSIPTTLTPDLVQTIRVNTDVQATWEDAVRFLLTGVVRNIGDGRFEMRQDYRQQFTEELKADKLGKNVSEVVARVLLEYYDPILEQGADHPDYHLARIQEITAFAYLDADYAYRKLREEFERLAREENPVERVRLANLVESLEPQFEDRYEELVYYAKSWRFEVQQNEDRLREALEPLVKKVDRSGSGQVSMPVPEQMYRNLRAEQIAENPLEEARRRIEKWREVTDPEQPLDLSGIGLTEVPEELEFKGLDVRRLNLSRNPLKFLTGPFSKMEQLEELLAENCELWAVDPEVFQCRNLTQLYLRDNHLRNLPRTSIKGDLELHLEKNSFDSLAPNVLDSGAELYIQGNPVHTAFRRFQDEGPSTAQIPSKQAQQSVDYGQMQSTETAQEEEPLRRDLEMLDVSAFKHWQTTLERGPSRIIKSLVWTLAPGDLPGEYADDGRKLVQKWKGVHASGEREDIYKWKASLQKGKALGLAPDLELFFLEIAHEGHSFPISAFFSHHSVLTIQLANSVADTVTELERWLDKIPQKFPQKVAIWTSEPEHTYFERLSDSLPGRFPGVIQLGFFDPGDPVSYQQWLDFMGGHPSRTLDVPDTDQWWKYLVRTTGPDPINEKDLNVLNPVLTGPSAGGDSLHWNWEQLAELGELFELPSPGRKDKGQSYQLEKNFVSGFQLISFFLSIREHREHNWTLSEGDFQSRMSQYFSQPGLARLLEEKFLELGWIQPSPQSPDTLLFPADIPYDLDIRPALDDKTWSVLEIHFHYLPPVLFSALARNYFSLDFQNTRVTRNWIYHQGQGGEILWEYLPRSQRIDLTCANHRVLEIPDGFLTDVTFQRLKQVMDEKWPGLKYTLYIKSKKNPIRYHVPTVKSIQREEAFPHTTFYTPYRRYFTSLFSVQTGPREDAREVEDGATYVVASVKDYALGREIANQLRGSVNLVRETYPDISPDQPEISQLQEFVQKGLHLIWLITPQSQAQEGFIRVLLEMLEMWEAPEKLILLVEGWGDIKWEDWIERLRKEWREKEEEAASLQVKQQLNAPVNAYLVERQRAEEVLSKLYRLEPLVEDEYPVYINSWKRFGTNWLIGRLTGDAPTINPRGGWGTLILQDMVVKTADMKELAARFSPPNTTETGLSRASAQIFLTHNYSFPNTRPNGVTVVLIHQDEPQLPKLEEPLEPSQTHFEWIALYEAEPNPAVRFMGKSPAKMLQSPASPEEWDLLALAILESGNRIAGEIADAPDNINWLLPNEFQRASLRSLYLVYIGTSFYRKREERMNKDFPEELRKDLEAGRKGTDVEKGVYFRSDQLEEALKPIYADDPNDSKSLEIFARRLLQRRILIGWRIAGLKTEELNEKWVRYGPGSDVPDLFAALGFADGDIPLDPTKWLPEERAHLERYLRDDQ